MRAGEVLTEQTGRLTFNAPRGAFTLTAKADRIEKIGTAAVAILDYKTGSPPSMKQVTTGLSPQLTLEAAIALDGGFAGLTPQTVEELVYVALKGSSIAGDELVLDFDKSSADEQAAIAKAGLEKFVASFDAPDMPYLSKPRVLLERFAGDYDHLARVKEWSAGDVE